MTTQDSKRKLAAILSADAKGYSRLMSQNEEATVETLRQRRATISGLVSEYRGRVVDSPGDNVLAEFGSVVDAAKCALEIQKALKEQNAELPENRRMDFRIGVNLGDVIEEEGRIYGDGVNIAARLEGLADASGICVSGTAFDHVKNRLQVGYQYLGKQTVKNIPDPIRTYKVLMEAKDAGKVIGETEPTRRRWGWKAIAAVAVLILGIGALVWGFYWRASKIEPASKDKMAFPLPDKPSIAVLPFTNMSGDPKEDYFCDGITDQIITSLSMIPRLFVIARNSTFVYKAKAVKVQKVAEEQGVWYVLEGSVQKSQDRVRITVQLIDAIKGIHLWSERYDRDLKDLFALQDEISMKIMTALQVKLTEGEHASAVAGTTSNLNALEYFWHAEEHFFRFSKEENMEARRWAEKAIELDSNFAGAWALLGWTHLTDVMWGNSPTQSMKRAEECAHQALSINDSTGKAQSLMGTIRVGQGKYDEGVEYGEKALALNPNEPDLMYALSMALGSTGRFDEAIVLTKKAMRICPYYPALYLQGLATFYVNAGRYQEAVEAGELLLDRSRKGEISPFRAHICLAEAYVGLGQIDKAKAEAEEVLKINPKYSLESDKTLGFYKDPMIRERHLVALRKAGLPDKPPLPLPDKPSIAVLPFTNMSDDKSQEYFSDGLTEEIITALSKTPKLFVIARNSSFVYKGKPVNVQQVSRELGVKYVLEGSVRRSGDQLRITAQLIDATIGNHLWAERYDRKMKDVFAIQDEITMKVVNAMQVTLTTGEQVRLLVIGTKNLDAYLKVLQGAEHFMRSKADNIRALELFKEAIAMDPDYPMAHAHLALAYSTGVWLGFASSPQNYLKRGLESAQKAISLNDSSPIAHNALALSYLMNREHDKAISESKKAVTLDPNGAWSNFWLGHILIFAGKPEEAIPYLQAAIRLDPFSRSAYFTHLCMAYREAGRYEEAIAAGQEAVRGMPNNLFAHLALASTYNMIGREEEARAEAAEALKINPNFSLKDYAETRPHVDPENTARFVDSLRKAGLK